MVKKIAKITGIVVLVLFVLALILPFVFKDKIIARVKEEANKSLNAVLEFGDLNISLIRNFPNVTITLEHLSLAGVDDFAGDTLISAGKIRATADLMSVISGDEIVIRKVNLNDANLHLKVLADGKANWDIVKPSPEPPPGEPEPPSAFKASLKYYSIENSNIIYEDRSMNMIAALHHVNHNGSGDFTADFTNLDTETRIDSLNFIYEGIPYLKGARINYKAGFALDLANSKYEFRENELKLNDLMLKFAGYVAMPGDDIAMDIKYEALKNEVKSFISLFPGSYTQDFDKVKSSGTLSFNGHVKGIYNEKSIPGFGINLLIENGMIQYPDLPEAIKNLQVNCSVENPGGSVDGTVVNLRRFHADLGANPVDAKLILKTPVSDPDIDASIKAAVNLGSISKLLPLDKNTTLSGDLKADASFRGRMSTIEKQQYQNFHAAGTMTLTGFNYISPDLPDEVRIKNAAMIFTPQAMRLNAFAMNIGKSDISADGALENYLAYALQDGLLKGNLNVNSASLDLNPFMSSDPVPAAEPAPAVEESMGYIRVPRNLNFTLNATAGKVLYDNLSLTNLKGKLTVNDGVLNMSNLFMNLLGGSITLSGAYDTREDSGPSVNFDLNAANLIIKETAKTFNTVKQLAPIAENTTGSVSVKLGFSSKADKQFNFIYPTFNGSGSLQTTPVVIEGFEMIKRTAEALKIDKLKKWQMERISARFSIKQGRIHIEPFDTKIAGYKTTIGGSNGLNQSIDYAINIEIPRSEFGGQANSVLTSMVAKASSAGINAQLGDNIPVNLKVTGTFTDPKVSTALASQAKDVMLDLKKQAEDALKDEAERRKKELEDKARAEKERLMNQAEKEKERLKQEAEKRAREEAEKAKQKAAEEAKKNINKLFKNK